jgi:hypothetical protein
MQDVISMADNSGGLHTHAFHIQMIMGYGIDMGTPGKKSLPLPENPACAWAVTQPMAILRSACITSRLNTGIFGITLLECSQIMSRFSGTSQDHQVRILFCPNLLSNSKLQSL